MGSEVRQVIADLSLPGFDGSESRTDIRRLLLVAIFRVVCSAMLVVSLCLYCVPYLRA